MARRGSGLNVTLRVLKGVARELDRADKARQRDIRRREREAARYRRDVERQAKAAEREIQRRQREAEKQARESWKDYQVKAAQAYEARCARRTELRQALLRMDIL
jgi:Skp family chaperone for outer membrane proteins